MKILIIADKEERFLWDYYNPKRTEGVDLILSCGDLKPMYLEFLQTVVNRPLLYVRGNHDDYYEKKPPQGCTCIEDRIYDFHGLRILGLGGSMKYNTRKNMYTEEEMARRVRRADRQIVLRNGFDILLAHAPAKGYGDMEDLPHNGFDCFNDLLNKYRPAYMFYGHCHKSYGGFQRQMEHPSGTVLVNGYGYYTIEIPEDSYPGRGKTGSALYDLYVSMVDKRRKY
ncbi:MAG: metallophosphoesterase family protein [Lachnospiraceae bacterium]|nr:metallophosphoesterase family protein [Lachnospiraceae bacterium]